MVKQIHYSYGLDFEDVLKYIPKLTASNEVVTDGKILHLQLQYFTKEINLFVDTSTMEYCFDTKSDDESDLLFEIGDIVLAKYHFFNADLEGLKAYILANLTFCEVQS